MELGRWLPTLAVVLGGLVAGAGSADASSTTAGMMAPTAAPSMEAASLRVSPVRVAPGGMLHVTGHCDPNTSGFVLSTAFLRDGTHEFAGVGAVRVNSDTVGAFSADAQIPADRTPGTYAVGARCGGANLGVSATVVVTSAGLPTAVPAGSGGGAISTSPIREAPVRVLIVGFALLAIAGAVLVRRRLPRSLTSADRPRGQTDPLGRKL
jgi:hypothetical protein